MPRFTIDPSPTITDQTKNMMPLDYMLSVIRDVSATKTRRDRMAALAAPYCHPKIADITKGKKDQREEAAETAGVGTPWASVLEEIRAN